MELLNAYWPAIAIAVVLLIFVAVLILRPRQRVTLSDSETVVRPHMQAKASHVHRGIAGEAATAVSDVSGQIINAPVHENLPGASGPPDDLTKLKGVGPKFARLLNDLGLIRFDQLARLSEGDIDRLDQHLGAFKGRLERDQIPLQADYLARNDIDGYEQRFGKL